MMTLQYIKALECLLLLLFALDFFVITAGQQAALQRGKVLMKQFPEIRGLYHDFGVIGKHGDIYSS